MTTRKKALIFIILGAISTTLVLLAGLLTLTAFAILGGLPPLSGAEADTGYEMYCEGETVKASRGEHITLTVTLKNNTGEVYSYEGSFSELKPEIVLVSEDGKFKIEHNDMPFTNDFSRHTFKDGDTRTTLFYFTIPENAPTGSYRAEMRFEDSQAEQADVIRVSG